MLDFLTISTRPGKHGTVEIYPSFIMKTSNDLMIRGGDFYAIWVEDRGVWSTNEEDALQLIDRELDKYAEENRDQIDGRIRVLHMWDAASGMIDTWHKYCQKQMWDTYHMLDDKIIFSNMKPKKRDYSSKRLNYPLEEGSIEAYDKLISVLYAPEERHKIEWAIGSIVTGDSKKIQKFLVLYGAMGTGKSTVLNIIEKLFDGYWCVFDAKAIGSASNAFALESLRTNPLVGIQHDGDLSRIEDNTRLNSLVSHEVMTVNEKFKSTYANRFNAFLFLGTNKPVKITDAKSGLIRRLIDVSPTGEKIPKREYDRLVAQIDFELGAIAYHCQQVYLENPNFYDDYIPLTMLGATNDFYNFVEDSYHVFKNDDGTTLKAAWEMYKTFCEEAKVGYILPQRAFKEELKNYFRSFDIRPTMEDGSRPRNVYTGFRTEKFEDRIPEETSKTVYTIKFEERESEFDRVCADWPAQYASSTETPSYKWDKVTTKLSDLDTSKLHYVKSPDAVSNHIVIDFDLKDDDGNKSFAKNLEAASQWPATYAELSKSGAGIHLHYIYTGDVDKLSRVYADNIEVKVYTGNSSIRRKLTKCNSLPIATISSGLPLKEEKRVINTKAVQNEKALRTLIKRNLMKEIHPATKPSIDFIYKILTDAYNTGMHYDVTDMRNMILTFAANSTNNAEYCVRLVGKMPFKSDESSEVEETSGKRLAFYDVEVFPNLFLICWKYEGENQPCVRMFNPKPKEIEEFLKLDLIGFNNRRYDNHIVYAALMGYTPEQLFNLSSKIVGADKKVKDRDCFFGEAYNISKTDVFDFAAKKQSLKKWEIELGISHKELGLPWNQPVPERLWDKVAEYCENDVRATEAVFKKLKADFLAREILAAIAKMTVNDTTNTLTTRIIFGSNKRPQDVFNYRNMGDESQIYDPKKLPFYISSEDFDEYTAFDKAGRPIFPGYRYGFGDQLLPEDHPEYKACKRKPISLYRDEIVGEGGYVYAEPGMYTNVALLDIASMHPGSIIAEQLFGPEYTKRFQEIRDARIAIKHKEFDKARKMLGGALAPYLDDESKADDLALALKIAINSVYGLTSASFENPFRDRRNKDNIVAKRGALFMVNLKHEVQKRGFIVAHIKTDSIKIPNATPEIIKFVMDYGKMYGYTFEHEATYDRMCLVNDAVYIAKYDTEENCQRKYGYIPSDIKKHPGEWTATGTQFQVPYVFKKLFSHEDILFEDLCETKSVTTAIYIDRSPDEAAIYINHPEVVEEGVGNIMLDNGHDLQFVGKVGQFCPMNPGCGGGELVRENKDKNGNLKYDAVTGSKGYLWMESEMVYTLNRQGDIDRGYYDTLVNDAVESISKYGDFEMFTAEDIPENAFAPPWFDADEPWNDVGNAFDVR